MRLKGKLLKWNNEKAFGFIVPNGGGDHVFIHKTAFSNRNRIPKQGDIITFSITKDKQGRYCATEATFSGEKLKKKQAKSVSKFSIYLATLFLLAMIAAFITNKIPLNVVLVYFGCSIITFVAYAFDKSKAQRGVWRTAESTLHFLALIGGWPGAAIAQQALRHKSQKKEFRVAFWFTVIVNCSGLAWLVSENGAHLLSLFR